MSVRHTCHALDCTTRCPRAHLMCRSHWSLVPRELQLEVCRTAPLRGHRCDETWAPWWRAQSRAVAAVAELEACSVPVERTTPRRNLAAWLERQLAFADELERRTA